MIEPSEIKHSVRGCNVLVQTPAGASQQSMHRLEHHSQMSL